MCQYPRPEKLVARPGIEPGSPAYMADALTFELLTTPVTMTVETLTDGPKLYCSPTEVVESEGEKD